MDRVHVKAIAILVVSVGVLVLGFWALGWGIAIASQTDEPEAVAQTAQGLPGDPLATSLQPEQPQGVTDPGQATSPPALDSGLELEQLSVDIYNKSLPSVVSVNTPSGGGSGWVWDADGIIVTNYHVVECSICLGGFEDDIEVEFSDGLDYDATVLGGNNDADLAVLSIQRTGLTPLPLGDSADIQPGQLAFAIGSPFGEDFSITQGIVSAVGRLLPSGDTGFQIGSVIQTDAALNPGNSGGPLLNSDGAVIGINSQIQSTSGGNSGVGFSIPSDLLKRVVPVLMAGEEYRFSYIGISGLDVDNDAREEAGIPESVRGTLIQQIFPNSPAAASGLISSTSESSFGGTLQSNFDGDIITAIEVTNLNGGITTFPTSSFDELIGVLELYTSPGDVVSFIVFREGEYFKIPVTLAARES